MEGKSSRLQCIETGGESNKDVLQKPYQTSKLKAKDNRGSRNWHDRTKFLIDVSEADQTLYHLVHRQHQQHCQIKYHFNLHVIFIVILIIFLHEQSQSYWGRGWGGGEGGTGRGRSGQDWLTPFFVWIYIFIEESQAHRLTGPAISSSSLPVSPNPDPRNDFLIFEN